jgi:TPP-dependent pyruvate/acetoin dehydrogenase alpha subunit
LARDWIWGAWRSSAKMKVFGAEVARVMRSAAARGEEADLVRARKGCSGQYLKKLRA